MSGINTDIPRKARVRFRMDAAAHEQEGVVCGVAVRRGVSIYDVRDKDGKVHHNPKEITEITEDDNEVEDN